MRVDPNCGIEQLLSKQTENASELMFLDMLAAVSGTNKCPESLNNLFDKKSPKPDEKELTRKVEQVVTAINSAHDDSDESAARMNLNRYKAEKAIEEMERTHNDRQEQLPYSVTGSKRKSDRSNQRKKNPRPIKASMEEQQSDVKVPSVEVESDITPTTDSIEPNRSSTHQPRHANMDPNEPQGFSQDDYGDRRAYSRTTSTASSCSATSAAAGGDSEVAHIMSASEIRSNGIGFVPMSSYTRNDPNPRNAKSTVVTCRHTNSSTPVSRQTARHGNEFQDFPVNDSSNDRALPRMTNVKSSDSITTISAGGESESEFAQIMGDFNSHPTYETSNRTIPGTIRTLSPLPSSPYTANAGRSNREVTHEPEDENWSTQLLKTRLSSTGTPRRSGARPRDSWRYSPLVPQKSRGRIEHFEEDAPMDEQAATIAELTDPPIETRTPSPAQDKEFPRLNHKPSSSPVSIMELLSTHHKQVDDEEDIPKDEMMADQEKFYYLDEPFDCVRQQSPSPKKTQAPVSRRSPRVGQGIAARMAALNMQ